MDHHQYAMNQHANSYVSPTANAAPNMPYMPVANAAAPSKLSALPTALAGLGMGAMPTVAPVAPAAGRTSAGAILVLFILLVIISRLGHAPVVPCKKKC